METIGKYIILGGILLILIGGVVFLAGKLGISGLPLGRLPGDIRIQSGGVTCVFPIVTMILVSVVLTILVNVIARLIK